MSNVLRNYGQLFGKSRAPCGKPYAKPSICSSLFSISDRIGYDIKNCSRYWHVFDFDASTAKFKIYQNKLTHTAPKLKKSIVNPNCSCQVKNDISSDDVISSAEKISVTAKNLMVDKLCVNEMKNIYDNSSKPFI